VLWPWQEYVYQRQAVPAAELEQMIASLVGSPLVARSTLAGSFRSSQGFAATFRGDTLDRLEERFPAVLPFVRTVLGTSALLRPRWSLRSPVQSNGFYLNLLVLPAGASIGRHVDATLRGPSGVADAVPARVSVLYLSVPAVAAGAELRLYREERQVLSLRPEPGALLHFRGDLAHEVTSHEGPAGEVRASLVLEQYALPEEAAGRLPELNVHSKASLYEFLVVIVCIIHC
jgi:hypothetical protein